MKCFLCNIREPLKHQCLCGKCNWGIQHDDLIKNQFTDKRSEIKKRLEKYREENLSKMPPRQIVATRITKEACDYFNYNVASEIIRIPYIIDIYIRRLAVGLEIDGGVHKHQHTYDLERDNYLKKTYNIDIYRFQNDQIRTYYFRDVIWHLCLTHYKTETKRIEKIAKSLKIMLPLDWVSLR